MVISCSQHFWCMVFTGLPRCSVSHIIVYCPGPFTAHWGLGLIHIPSICISFLWLERQNSSYFLQEICKVQATDTGEYKYWPVVVRGFILDHSPPPSFLPSPSLPLTLFSFTLSPSLNFLLFPPFIKIHCSVLSSIPHTPSFFKAVLHIMSVNTCGVLIFKYHVSALDLLSKIKYNIALSYFIFKLILHPYLS